MHLPAQSIRCMDNVVGVKFTAHSLDTMKLSLEDMYGLELQVEGQGPVWPSLLTTLEIRGDQPCQQVGMHLHDKLEKFPHTFQTVHRYPDVGTPKLFRTLRSLVPRLAKDIVYYRSALDDLRSNITMVQRDLACKNPSTASWYPRLRRDLEKWGVDRCMLNELRRTAAP